MSAVTKRPHICIIGAGISGLGTATVIQEKYPEIDISIIAEKISPETTSDGAAGIICTISELKHDKNRKRWLKQTYEKIKTLHKMDYSPEIGICQMQIYDVYQSETGASQECIDTFPGTRVLTQEEMNMFPSNVRSGVTYLSYVVQGARYLPWLMKRFQSAGGKMVKKKVHSLSELAGLYDVVVNCTGLGSVELVGDKSMVPIRGQVLRVDAPWIKHCVRLENFHSEDGICAYIIPQIESVVIGGCRQVGNTSKENSETVTKQILQLTSEFLPSLKKAKILNIWTGLRPGRPSIRVEKEVVRVNDKHGIEHLMKVVHNYGHGGAGLLLHYGCALDACDLVGEMLTGILPTQSKL